MEEEGNPPPDPGGAPQPGDPSEAAGSGPGSRGRHDIVESRDTNAFWPEVDGMLTGEFSADLIPKIGDYKLGAITGALDPAGDAMPPPSLNATSELPSTAPPMPPHPAEAAGAQPATTTSVDPFSLDQFDRGTPDQARAPETGADGPQTEGQRRGAHDIDPDQLGFNVVEGDEGFGGFLPDLSDGPFDPTSESGSRDPARPTADPPSTSRPAQNVPTVSTSSTRLFDEIGDLPPVGQADGGRLFPPRAEPDPRPAAATILAGDHPPPPPPGAGSPEPIIDLTREGQPGADPTVMAGSAAPAALQRSTVVDPSAGAPAGSSFLEDSPGYYGPAGPDTSPTINVEADHRSNQQPGLLRIPDKPSGPRRRDLLLDIVDRRWFTSALVATMAVVVGVLGWIVFLRGDGGDGADLIAVSTTTTVDVSGQSAAQSAAGAAARGESSTSATTVATTESTEAVTSSATTSSSAPRRRTTTTAATSLTTAATTPTTASTTTTEDTTTTTEDTTTTTEDTTTTTEDTTTTTEDTTTTTEDTTTTEANSSGTTGSSSSNPPGSDPDDGSPATP